MTSQPATAASRLRGFTLVELLIVIAIIGILAGLLLPALGQVKKKAMIKTAKLDMKNIELALSQYENDYSRMPVDYKPLAGTRVDDKTYGLQPYLQPPPGFSATGPYMVRTNADVMFTLLAQPAGVNASNAKNPRQTIYYKAAQTTSEPNKHGVSTVDGQVRDPWGNPYVISLDLNGDGFTKDAVYSLGNVSALGPNSPSGLNGLLGTEDKALGTWVYQHRGPVMIWSLGPDKAYRVDQPANKDANKDNILSWVE